MGLHNTTLNHSDNVNPQMRQHHTLHYEKAAAERPKRYFITRASGHALKTPTL